MKINGKIYTFNSNKKIKVPKGSEIEIVSIDGSRGSFAIPVGVNLNWCSFHARYLNVNVKNDYEKKFNIKIWS